MKKTISSILAVVLLFAFASTANAQITKDQYYARSTLSGNELEYYDDLYDAIKDGHGLYGGIYGISDDRAFQIAQYVYNDSPELYGGYLEYPDKEQIDQKADEILSLLTEDMTDYEKVKTIYYWLAKHIEYGENEEAGDQGQTIVGALVYEKAVCAGISSALQYLLYKIDIPCYFVESETHGWNIIQIDGKWYNADLTKDMDMIKDGQATLYFLVDDKTIQWINEQPADYNPPLPKCTEIYSSGIPIISNNTPPSTPEPDMAAEVTGEPTGEAAEVTGEPTSEAAEAQEDGPGNAFWYALGGAAVAAILLIIWAVRRKKKQK